MALDRSKLNKGFQTYLANAEKFSGKTYEDFALVLSQSGLKKHGELREHLMGRMGLGHGHANAVTAIWLLPGNNTPVAVEKAPAKGPVVKKAAAPVAKAPAKAAPAKAAAKPMAKPVAKPAAKKAAAKKPAAKPAPKKPAKKK